MNRLVSPEVNGKRDKVKTKKEKSVNKSGQDTCSTKAQCDNTTSKAYARLTEEERYQIYEGVIKNRSHREIAALISKHHSSVSREVKRNKGLRGYRPKQAQGKAQERQQSKSHL